MRDAPWVLRRGKTIGANSHFFCGIGGWPYALKLAGWPAEVWSRKTIEECRVRSTDNLRSGLQRIVVAIDPAVTSGEESDETGIVVAGRDSRGHAYVLDDLSGRYAPLEWARRAIDAYRRYAADRIVAEVNNGGDMVEATIRMMILMCRLRLCVQRVAGSLGRNPWPGANL
jgi:phage terminase large subunit-like protein